MSALISAPSVSAQRADEIAPLLTRRSASASVSACQGSPNTGSPSLALRKPSSGRFKIALPEIDEHAIARFPSLPAKGRRRRNSRYRGARPDVRPAPRRRRKHGRRDGRGSPLPCPAHIAASAYGRSAPSSRQRTPAPIAKRGGVLTLTAKLRGDLTIARAASAVCGGRPGFAAKAGAPRLISSSVR